MSAIQNHYAEMQANSSEQIDICWIFKNSFTVDFYKVKLTQRKKVFSGDPQKFSFTKRFLVTSVSGVQIMKKIWVLYRHHILPLKMKNLNITQRETHTAGLGVMIGKCSLDSQNGDLIVVLRVLAGLFSVTQTTNKAITYIWV